MSDLHTSHFLFLVDCASTHTFLYHKEFIHHIKDQASFNIKTIVGPCEGQGRGPATIQLPNHRQSSRRQVNMYQPTLEVFHQRH